MADYIYESLGFQVKPAEVPLFPRGSDLYKWRILPGNEKKYFKIFSKSWSDHSVNALRLFHENAQYGNQLRTVAEELAAERDHRRDLEEENRNLRGTQSLLEKKFQDQVDIAENFRRALARCATVLPILENIRKQIAEFLGDRWLAVVVFLTPPARFESQTLPFMYSPSL
ncbi:hypothetical protein PspLS_06276 [Pyricularia sp. CBS 133598]|nr:hypothetical protein PspLS_06276 [Pyricularia sp. CBS 133598]